MLKLDQINNTIEELEHADTTFDTCFKLASLYIVKEHFEQGLKTTVDDTPEVVEEELNDILPSYRRYCDVKRNWQLHNADKSHVLSEMEKVCQEIQEFIEALYSSTNMVEERDILHNTLKSLYSNI